MSTTAAVVWNGKVHYFGSDGYPSEIVPELARMSRLQITNERAFWIELHKDWEFRCGPYGPENSTEYVYELNADWTSVDVTGHFIHVAFDLTKPVGKRELDHRRWTAWEGTQNGKKVK